MKPAWFPDRKIIDVSEHLFDDVHTDFDVYAARYKEHDIECQQLTRGPFRGRTMSVHLEDLQIYTGFTSQALDSIVLTPPGSYGFSIALEHAERLSYFGQEFDQDSVHVLPPRGEISKTNLPDSSFMVLTVDRDVLLAGSGLEPEISDWLLKLGLRGERLRSAMLARKLKELQADVLEMLVVCQSQKQLEFLNRFVLIQLSTALTLAWRHDAKPEKRLHSSRFDRFQNVRRVFQSLIEEGRQGFEDGLGHGELALHGSRRLIEMAFKASVDMGPLQYLRVMRLHHVRRKLLQPERLQQSIGDIAAEEGFWDPSKFGAYYSRQFGERPSDTRKRLDPDELSRSRPPH